MVHQIVSFLQGWVTFMAAALHAVQAPAWEKLNTLLQAILRFFAPQQWHATPIWVKYGMEEVDSTTTSASV